MVMKTTQNQSPLKLWQVNPALCVHQHCPHTEGYMNPPPKVEENMLQRKNIIQGELFIRIGWAPTNCTLRSEHTVSENIITEDRLVLAACLKNCSFAYSSAKMVETFFS